METHKNTPEIDEKSALLLMLLEQRQQDYADHLVADGRNDKLILVGPDLSHDPKTSTRAEITYYSSDRQAPQLTMRYGTSTSGLVHRFRMGENDQYELTSMWQIRASDQEPWYEYAADDLDSTSEMIKAFVRLTEMRPAPLPESRPVLAESTTTLQRVQGWLGGLTMQRKS